MHFYKHLILVTFSIFFFSSVYAEDKKQNNKLETKSSISLLEVLNAKENFRSHVKIIRQGLIGDQITNRARSAQWFIKHGTIEDVPFLIKSLSDESSHKGANYPLSGMATTRYWVNVALVVICKTSYDFQWDASKEKRDYSISLWKQHWDRINPKNK